MITFQKRRINGLRFVYIFVLVITVTSDELFDINEISNAISDELSDLSDYVTPSTQMADSLETTVSILSITDEMHGVKMGIPSPCDSSKMDTSIDWDGNPDNYTCLDDIEKYQPNYTATPEFYELRPPKSFQRVHVCLSSPITYEDPVPTYGDHRPLWPKYGEYMFLPAQRWLHSLEHGAVAMLYHPCADGEEVQRLKDIVKNCLRRHVITPWQYVNASHPLVLVTWGYRLSMSYADESTVVAFIREFAGHGPEKIVKNGFYNKTLIDPAKNVSDYWDRVFCPSYPWTSLDDVGSTESEVTQYFGTPL